MRLTLRTLLAYLDGLLPDEQRRELESKVAASSLAPHLVERIRELVCRPGLAAPRTDGRGLAEDANTVAEFLDNALPADRLEAFERVCLESDIHLAEAADCHASLAELALETVRVEPLDRAAQRRVLQEVAGHLGEPVRDTDHAESLAMVRQLRQAMAEPAAPRAASGGGGRRRSLASWFMAAASVVLLAALGLLLVRTLRRPPRPRVAAANQAAFDAEAARPVGPEAFPEQEASGGDADGPDRPPEPAAAVIPSADRMPEPAADPPEPSAEPAAAAPPGRDGVPAGGSADLAGVVRLPMMEAATDDRHGTDRPEKPASDRPPPAGPTEEVAVVTARSLLLHWAGAGDDRQWERLPPGPLPSAATRFVVPEHARPTIQQGSLRIELVSGTLGSLRSDPDGTLRVEIVFGGGVAWTEAAEARLGVIAGGLTGLATIGPRQPLGIFVELVRPPGDDPAVETPGQRATLFAAGGTRWLQTTWEGGQPGIPLAGIDLEQPLPAGTGLGWSSLEPGVARPLASVRPPEWLRPDWTRVLTGSQAVAPADSWAARAMEAGLAGGGSAEIALRQMTDGRRPEDRVAAAATLAVLGDYDGLVRLLSEERPGRKLRESQWSRLAGVADQALARGANAAARLRQAFLQNTPAGRGDDLYRCALGVDPERLTADEAAALIAQLDDPLLAIRRYAARNLTAAFPEAIEAAGAYAPDRDPRLNKDAVSRWRRAVEAAGGAAEP